MDNAVIIGSVLMALTSTLSLAGVLVRTGKLVEKVERLEELNAHLQVELKVATEQITVLTTTIRVIETKLQYTLKGQP